MKSWIRVIHEEENNPVNIITMDDNGTKYDLLEILDDTDPLECSEIRVGDIFNLSATLKKDEGICNIGVKAAQVVPCIEFKENGEGERSQWVFVELIDLPDGFDIW